MLFKLVQRLFRVYISEYNFMFMMVVTHLLNYFAMN